MLRIFGHFVPASSLGLAFAELVLMAGAVYSMLVLGSGLTLGYSHFAVVQAQLSGIAAAFAVITMGALGLYSPTIFLDFRGMVIKIVLAFALASPLIILLALYYTRVVAGLHFERLWYIEAPFIGFVCVILARAIFVRVVKISALKRRVIVIGTGARAERIRQLSEVSLGSQFVPVAFIAAATDAQRVAACPFTLDSTTGADALVDFARRLRASEIVVATDDRRGLPVHPLLGCKARGITVTDFLSFCERETGRVDLEALQPSWLIFSDGFRMSWIGAHGEARLRHRRERGHAGADPAAPRRSPPSPSSSRTAARSSTRRSASVCFGRPFTLYKFRSMRVDAESGGGPQWAAKDDPRITRVGAYHPQGPHRRAAAAHQCPQGRHELRRPAPRAALFRRAAGPAYPVLRANATRSSRASPAGRRSIIPMARRSRTRARNCPTISIT